MIKRKWWLKPTLKRNNNKYFAQLKDEDLFRFMLTVPPPNLLKKIVSVKRTVNTFKMVK